MNSTKGKKVILGLVGTILGLVWLAPFYMMIANSLKTKKEIFQSPLRPSEGFNVENYAQAAENLNFG